MIAVIGGETGRFRPLVDLYREAGEKAGHSPEQLKVGVHSLGYVAETSEQAVELQKSVGGEKEFRISGN